MPTIEGVSVRADMDETTNAVLAVSFEHEGSTLQVSAFAAAKNEPLWGEIYEQLKISVQDGGGKFTETIGGLGKQLETELVTPNGPTPIRFIGFDGPRWFLRGVVSGAALTDPSAAINMEDIFRSLVVDRGSSPLPPREPLPLRLPDGTFAPPKFEI